MRESSIQEICENIARMRHYSFGRDRLMLSGYGLSPTHHEVLRILYRLPGTTTKELSEYLAITPSAITQLLDPLVNKGLLSRQADVHDRRIIRLNLTPEGIAKLKRLKRRYFGALRQSLEGLNDKELAALIKIQTKMLESLEKGTKNA